MDIKNTSQAELVKSVKENHLEYLKEYNTVDDKTQYAHLKGCHFPFLFPIDGLSSGRRNNVFDIDFKVLDFINVKKDNLDNGLKELFNSFGVDAKEFNVEHKVYDVNYANSGSTYVHDDQCSNGSILWYYSMEDDKFEHNCLDIYSNDEEVLLHTLDIHSGDIVFLKGPVQHSGRWKSKDGQTAKRGFVLFKY